MEMKHHLRKMIFKGKSYNALTNEKLEDLIVSKIYNRKYKKEFHYPKNLNLRHFTIPMLFIAWFFNGF